MAPVSFEDLRDPLLVGGPRICHGRGCKITRSGSYINSHSIKAASEDAGLLPPVKVGNDPHTGTGRRASPAREVGELPREAGEQVVHLPVQNRVRRRCRVKVGASWVESTLCAM
jgi:hypothetical protein